MKKINIRTKSELFDFIDQHFDSFTSEQISEIIHNATGNYVGCINFIDCSTTDEKENLQVKKWTRELMKSWIDYYLQPDKRNKGIRLLNVCDI